MFFLKDIFLMTKALDVYWAYRYCGMVINKQLDKT